MLVTWALADDAQRDALHFKWSHYTLRHDIALAFVLGTPPFDLRVKLVDEDALYSDKFIGNFMDSY